MSDVINLTLNHFDDAGNVVDSDNMDIQVSSASDIIDHAAQLIIIHRSLKDSSSSEEFDLALSELEESLVTANII
ncbi:MAG: hypothetical protein QM500_12205 [Methylococcales bacterium]